jgi:hypothetical protein
MTDISSGGVPGDAKPMRARHNMSAANRRACSVNTASNAAYLE